MTPRLAVIGAGPVGLEMALAAVDGGWDVRVYEAGRVGAALGVFGDVMLFTPFALNSTEGTRARLRRTGVSLPEDGAMLGTASFVERYLVPMSRLPELQGRIQEECRVAAVSRDDRAGGRERNRFVLHLAHRAGAIFEVADAVIDASGTTQPVATGPGGLAAIGESDIENLMFRRLLPSAEATRDRFEGRRVLLIGSGHSAATALVVFETLSAWGKGPAVVHWIRRSRAGAIGGAERVGRPFLEVPDDPLPARAALQRDANRIAGSASWLRDLAGHAVLRYERSGEAVRVTVRAPDGGTEVIDVDGIYALTGSRPDIELFRELEVHLCYASEAPMALAAAMLTARSAVPGAASDCLSQTTHGAETLRTTEPGFFVIGAKSYGRSPDFLLRVGYEQVREVASLLEMTRPSLAG